MLGHHSGQTSLAELQLWSGTNKPLFEPTSFYDRFAQARPSLLRDEDFAHWFSEGTGRPSLPPSLVASAFLLALRDGCSDREAEQRMRYDLRWKWALGLGVHDSGCDHSSLCVFRARLLAHQEEDRLFRDLVERAVEAGLLPKRTMQVMDSSPMLGAAAVEDTYQLIRRALHLVVKAHERSLPEPLKTRLKRYRKAAKPKIDWQDPRVRKQELGQLVADAELALGALPSDGEWATVSKARQLLEQVAKQDVEPDGHGGVQIRTGVAPDRVISTTDPEMRHGRKSSAGTWNGYKKHLAVEPESELITAVAVTAANDPDGEVAMELLRQQADLGLAPEEVVADMAYASSELRAQALAEGEGTTIVTKAAALPASDFFTKADFKIDCVNGSVQCPAGQVAHFWHRPGHRTKATFSRRACAACPLATRCLRNGQASRTIHIEAYEDQLQMARERRAQPDFEALFSKRPTVERKIAHWNRRGAHQSRYFGRRKTLLQAFWSAAVVNLDRLMTIGSPFQGSPTDHAPSVRPDGLTSIAPLASAMSWRLVIDLRAAFIALPSGPTTQFTRLAST